MLLLRHPAAANGGIHTLQGAPALVSNARCWTTNSNNSVPVRSSHSRPRQPAASASGASGSEDDDGTDDAIIKPGKPLRVERLLANLGYGKRKECTGMIKRRQLVFADTGRPAKVGEKALPSQLLLDGEPLDPAPPLTLILHKPTGYVVTSPEDEAVLDPKVYDLLPYRFGRRRPFLSAVGRLDKDTSGLLLMTDDGQLLHSIQSPARGIWKRYRAQLAAPLTGKDAAKAAQRFASGQLQLQGDRTPLLPAALHMLDDTTAEVSICEGRYHQIKRMFAALGHTVVGLHRHTIGGLRLCQEPDLELGSWRLATQADIDAVLSGPESLTAVQHQHQQQGQQTASSSSEEAASEALSSSSSHSVLHESGESSTPSSLPLPSASRGSKAQRGQGSSSSSSSSGGEGPSEDEDFEDEEAYAEDDLDHPGESAAASKRFRTTSKRARRRAALLTSVRSMCTQSQQA